MNKLWSILFGVTMLACGLSFIIAPWMGWSLPAGVSTHSEKVDSLWYIILWIVGIFFFLTEAILVVFMYLYSGTATPKPARAAGWPGALKPLESVLHDSHRIEMAWTLIPAIILLYIAFAQIATWEEVKYPSRMPAFDKDKNGKINVPLPVDISARQFEWRLRYPHPARLRRWLDNPNDSAVRADYKSFAGTPQYDDVPDVNELHLWKDNPVVVYLTTRDVIHSFNIPVMRVKQDALPGKMIPVWFIANMANTAKDPKTGEFVDRVHYEYGTDGKVTKMEHRDQWREALKAQGMGEQQANAYIDRSARWDIPCAELCGWGHYRMIGRVYVHNTKDEFLSWLDDAAKRANAMTGPR